MGKALSTLFGFCCGVVAEFGEFPPPGVPSGEILDENS